MLILGTSLVYRNAALRSWSWSPSLQHGSLKQFREGSSAEPPAACCTQGRRAGHSAAIHSEAPAARGGSCQGKGRRSCCSHCCGNTCTLFSRLDDRAHHPSHSQRLFKRLHSFEIRGKQRIGFSNDACYLRYTGFRGIFTTIRRWGHRDFCPRHDHR
jgi:hypothetical protein